MSLSEQSEGVGAEVVMEGVWRAVVGGGSCWEFGREDGGVDIEVDIDGAWCEEVEVLAKLECAEGVEVLAKLVCAEAVLEPVVPR